MYERIKKEALLTDEELSEVEYFAIETPDRDAPESFKKRERRRAIAQAQLDKFLKHKDVLLRAENQSLPSVRNAVNKSYNDYMLGQEDMLTPDSEGRVWRKVIPKGR
ncbi:MAG TPA: hypothetical protein VMV76_07635 [Dehalococcoidia bacterium]|nr:hypothetical protein [Dehalococcoidia bacterium]